MFLFYIPLFMSLNVIGPSSRMQYECVCVQEGLPAAERAWHEYTRCKESLVLRLFYGQIRSTVRCVRCAERSATYDSFSNLSLELPAAAARCTLQVHHTRNIRNAHNAHATHATHKQHTRSAHK